MCCIGLFGEGVMVTGVNDNDMESRMVDNSPELRTWLKVMKDTRRFKQKTKMQF